MWMVLDDSLGKTTSSVANVRSALEQLLYSVGRGEHVVAASPAIARKLLEVELSPMPQAVLRQSLASAPDLLARLEQAKFRVRVVAEGVHPLRINDSEWALPLEWIRENGVPHSYILGENTRDAKLFRIAATHHRALTRTGTSFCTDIGSGGGADTPHVLTTELKTKRRFILCITDSDKACPTAPRNHTSIACSNIANGSNWVAFHVSLAEREVENLLPINLIEDVVVAQSPSDLDERLEALKDIAARKSEAWGYLDLKVGTPLHTMFGGCSDFWTEFKVHPICRGASDARCIDEGRCIADSKDNCKCLIAPPLSLRIVDHVIDYMERNSTHAIAKRSSTSLNAERWAEIGALVSDWGAAASRMRS